ncbi:ABC transporter substrate-binding protein [Microbacterium terricola]|uniref:Peptide ABC transporter substrate-binding protein n=1 Tax=Microbacterium terricola TaxID=344163 RepID=A0ABM8E1G8_9MICO|nr:ABC transporter substrate-binding protein [Microbacterium terricola]UYK40473.1 ABC transporter substrate-binding protein [Microbacterium terricola]BDV31804.1 peptide ABC transporter substrate-binding protein [Microbacterium terricola]
MSRITTARGAAVLATVAASALALSACTGSGGGGESGGAVDTSKLIIALDSDQAALGYDPARYGNGQRMFFEGIYDSLFVLDEEGKVVPQLVTSFEYNADQTELTLDLDTTATFDDGSTLTADLVKQNLDARGNPDLSAYSGFAKGGQNEISEVTVVDDDTVTLSFSAGKPGFEANLVLPAGAIVGPTGAADRSSLDATPDGSGPLKVDDATVKGNSYLLVKDEDNAAAADYPFDSYEFRPILDPQARVNAAISGEVDLAYVTSDTKAQVESADVGLVVNGGTIQNLIAFDKAGATAPQWGDPRVFQALSMAIDRDAYVGAVHPGEVPTANALPADNPGYVPELDDEYAYDPDAAKALLADAGYPDGFSFDFTITPASQRDLEAIQPYWEAIGVTVNLKNAASTEEAFAVVQTEPLGGPIPLTWTNPLGNVYGVLFGFANFHEAQNDQIQAAAGALGAAGEDAAAQETALKDLNRAIVDSGWLIPLYEQLAPWAYNTAKVAEPTFPGAEVFPILASLQPAS